MNSADLLASWPKYIDLSIRPSYRLLLERLGNPQDHLPPVFHVAGTNGKGSTCAFLRAILEASGARVHVYTSPHLVRVHERIRLAGELVSEEKLFSTLKRCRELMPEGGVTVFEVLTASAFALFSETPADYIILETGLGGRLDATNVVVRPLVTLITRLSYDHRDYLGNTLTEIAREKAGIMREGVPCIVYPQPDDEAMISLQNEANKIGAPLLIGGRDWRVHEENDGLHFSDSSGDMLLPRPGLLGAHQFLNAGMAVAALKVTRPVLSQTAYHGIAHAEWPARLQKLTSGKLRSFLPPQDELWLDGGHNDSAGEALAVQAAEWRRQDDRPLHLVVGMISTKHPEEFLRPLVPYIDTLYTINVPTEVPTHSAVYIAEVARSLGVRNVTESGDVAVALREIANDPSMNRRTLIAGSLYLAGHILEVNASK